jgi:sucrose phosphorylase
VKQDDSIVILHNLSNEEVICDMNGRFMNIITGKVEEFKENITLNPYQFLWLKQIN